jgi:hypothetical protein
MLDNFSVVALVLYDPSAHPGFAETLRQRFVSLDRLTGKHVAFFALVDDPRLFGKVQFREREDLIVQALGRTRRHPQTLRGSSQALCDQTLALAMTADIPYAALPCVMFTTRLDATSWSWVSVTPDTLDTCFKTLVRLTSSTRDMVRDAHSRASWVALQLSSDSDVQSKDRGIDELTVAQRSTVPPFGETHARRRLAAALADTLAVTQRRRPAPRLDLHEALGNRQKTTESPQQLSELLDDVLLRTLLARLGDEPRHERDRDWLAEMEPEARVAFHTARFLLEHHQQGLDTGIAVAALGKALEVTANGTAIQCLRHAHGVTMPRYFRSHDPGRGPIPIPIPMWGADGYVELNERRAREPWHALTLGEIYAVLKEEAKHLPALSEEVERLVILTHELSPLRNRGIHVGGVDLELARTFLTTLGDEGQRGLFARLAAGVARLRS